MQELGFASIALPDSIFYMEKQSTDYPYAPDGSRVWNVDTDPPLEQKNDAMKRFAETYIHSGWQQ
jgi:hypothetical protein